MPTPRESAPVSPSRTTLSMTPLARMPSRRSQVIATLRAAIISGEMQPGIVYSAPALAAQFGISPTPVREAMLQLANEGLIEVARNKGFRVVEPSDRELDEILELRQLLEVPAVGRIAAQGADADALARVEQLAQDTVAAAWARDIPRHIMADIAFHSELLALAGNAQLVEIVANLRSKSRLFGLSIPERSSWLRAVSDEHVRLVELVRERDAAGAERLMGEHLAHVRSEWRRDATD